MTFSEKFAIILVVKQKGGENMEAIIIIAYFVLGYWATGKTIYANKIRIGTMKDLLLNRLIVGFILGWILIPVAIVKCFIKK